MFRFNLNKILKINTPPKERNIRFIAWLKVYVSYLFKIMEDLYSYWETKDKEAKMTPQVAYLEHFLNDRYGTGVEIYITDGYDLGPWVWYQNVPAGQIDFFMKEPYNYCYPNTAATNIDFVVHVPHALSDQAQSIAAIVQKFKLAGKCFIIQLY